MEVASISSNKEMSARQKNIAIRRAKKLIKQRSKDHQDSVFTTSKRLDFSEIACFLSYAYLIAERFI